MLALLVLVVLPGAAGATAPEDCSFPNYRWNDRMTTDAHVTVNACGWTDERVGAETTHLYQHVFSPGGEHLRVLVISPIDDAGRASGTVTVFPSGTPSGRYKLIVSGQQTPPQFSSFGWDTDYQQPQLRPDPVTDSPVDVSPVDETCGPNTGFPADFGQDICSSSLEPASKNCRPTVGLNRVARTTFRISARRYCKASGKRLYGHILRRGRPDRRVKTLKLGTIRKNGTMAGRRLALPKKFQTGRYYLLVNRSSKYRRGQSGARRSIPAYKP